MSKKKRIFLGAGIIVVTLILCVATALADDGSETVSRFAGTIWSLVPPVIAIGLALITKEVYSSLFIGIVVGALLASNFSFTGTVDMAVQNGIVAAIKDTAGIFAFLVILGIFVALINMAGGSAAFGRWAKVHIKSKIGATLATFVLGVLIFIDDYFNCLTVGSVMRPVTDTHKVSRAKLAYLIDATAAPICMIAPISSWAAAVSIYVESTEYSGLELFVRAIPFNFYSLLTFVFIIALTLMKFDYGPMRIHEVNAREKGDLFTTGESSNKGEEGEFNPNGRVIDLVLPIILLIVLNVIALAYSGRFFDASSSCYMDFIGAIGDTNATAALPWGSILALIITIIYMICRRIVTFKDAMKCIPKGFVAMVPAILILTFATALKNMTGELNAAGYVKGIMDGAAAGLSNFLPAIIFIVACFLAFATGTSWGTFGILIPIVTNIFEATDPLLFVGISACLAGAVCGDHCSPISDTTIMSSAGAQCDHLNHVSTQLPYSISVAAISFVMFIISGFIPNAFIVLPIGIALTVLFLFVAKLIMKAKYKEHI